MIINATQAAQAYVATRPALTPEARSGPAEAFGSIPRDIVDTIQAGETTSKLAMSGQADAHALVQALAETELAIETAVTVRDKVVEAYQEILRMPV